MREDEGGGIGGRRTNKSVKRKQLRMRVGGIGGAGAQLRRKAYTVERAKDTRTESRTCKIGSASSSFPWAIKAAAWPFSNNGVDPCLSAISWEGEGEGEGEGERERERGRHPSRLNHSPRRNVFRRGQKHLLF